MGLRIRKDRDVMLAATEALGIGIVVSGFLFGFRHGIDWDHIAAITDITSSQEERGRALEYGTIYALGHALVVLVIGVAAIALGARLPEGVDEVMGRIVGVTLIALGTYVFAALVRHGREFRCGADGCHLQRSAYRRLRGGRRREAHELNRCIDTRIRHRIGGRRHPCPLSTAITAARHHHHTPEPTDDVHELRARNGVRRRCSTGSERDPTQVVIFTAAGAGGWRPASSSSSSS
jgi:hypothetical protein